MTRVTFTTEDEQDQKSSSSTLTTSTEAAAAQPLLKKFGIAVEIEELDSQPLYSIDAGFDKGGCQHELRTKDEIVEILKDHNISQSVIDLILNQKAPIKRYDHGMTTIRVTQTHSVPEPNTQQVYKLADILTDPNDIGESSYRAVAECAADSVEASPNIGSIDLEKEITKEDAEIIITEMEMLISHATSVAQKAQALLETPPVLQPA